MGTSRRKAIKPPATEPSAPPVINPPYRPLSPPPAQATEPAAPPVILQRNELKQTWTQPVALSPDAPAAAAPAPMSIEYDDTPQPDPVAVFLESLDLEQGYMLRVDRLTKWEVDGRSGVKAPKYFCRQYQFDLLNYLNQIADDFGGGNYWLTLRRVGDGAIMKNWTEHIEARNQTEPAAGLPFQFSGVSAGAPAAPPVAPFKDFLNFAKTIREINEQMGWVLPGQQPAIATQPAPAAPVADLRDRLLMAFVDRASSKGDDAALDKILHLLIGGNEPKEREGGFDFLEMLERIVGPMMPALLQGFVNLQAPTLPGQTIPAQLPAQVPAAPPLRMAPPPPHRAQISPIGSVPLGETIQSAAPMPPGAAPDGQDAETVFQQSIDDLLDSLATEISAMSKTGAYDLSYVQRGAEAMRHFQTQFPSASTFIAGLIYAPPADVLKSLESYHDDFAGIATLPLAADYVAALQQQMRNQP